MVRWSESVVPQARLTWINCWGVPISCWSSAFFMKLGWHIGEPLMVDINTVERVLLDKGRMLVLIPRQQQCSVSVNIVGGDGAFMDNKSVSTAKSNMIGQSKLEKRSRGLVVKRFLEKGKRKWIKKAREKASSFMVQNGNLNLEKRKEGDKVGVKSTEDNT
ncbi:hypothetical protein Dsin_014056 [Dipteronia sinensis]|uniref:DUF4283 domain-containing protein n=1 Tax=Dipteronia sinensis TaxID=43782 RepID=A0AAE0E9K4_9ROSI|nr:hypothetical protein Dsin_014056 [Dipteronia sinensis]